MQSHFKPICYSLAAVCFLMLSLSACSSTDCQEAEETALQFSIACFNFNYKEAVNYCSASYAKQLRLLVSNLNQADVEAIQHMPDVTTCEVIDSDVYNDTTALVTVRVHHYLDLQDWERKDSVYASVDQQVRLHKQNEKWLVSAVTTKRSN